nr:MAG TPA: hypothetical protein [Caudoviricetes sp.]
MALICTLFLPVVSISSSTSYFQLSKSEYLCLALSIAEPSLVYGLAFRLHLNSYTFYPNLLLDLHKIYHWETSIYIYRSSLVY